MSTSDHDDHTNSGGQGVLPPVELSFVTHDGWEAEWKVRSFTLKEDVGQPYVLDLEVISADVDVDVAALIGAACQLTLDRGAGARVIPGIVFHASAVALGPDRLGLTLNIGPALALLRHRRQRRIFKDQSTLEVAEAVIRGLLHHYERGYRFDVDSRHYPAREYVVQHDESDLDFIHRILADDGIHYHFEVDGGREVVVFADESARAPALTFDDDDAALPLVTHGHGSTPREGVADFSVEHSVTPESAAYRYWNWREADQPPTESSRGESDEAAGLALHDHRAPTPEGPEIGARRARRDLESAQAFGARSRGSADAIGLTPGRSFELRGHPQRACDRAYFITSVIHRGDAPDAQAHGSADARPRYRNEFVCIPASAPYRPPRPTAALPAIGPQTAIVVGPEGEEIHTDEYGRILVCFAWDRRPPEEAATCWIRVAQEWAGPGFGSQFIPRVGTEVLVEFLHGDPNQPVVTKCLYNSQHPQPFTLPDEKAVSGIRTDSTPGGGRYNELAFDDTRGREELRMHASRNMRTVVENDYIRRVGGNQDIRVNGDIDQRILGTHTRAVDGMDVVTVDQSRSVWVCDDLRTTVSLGELRAETLAGDMVHRSAQAIALSAGGEVRVRADGGDFTAVAHKSALLQGQEGAALVLGHTSATLSAPAGPAYVHGKSDVTIDAAEGELKARAAGLAEVESRGDFLALRGHAGIIATSPGKVAITAGEDVAIVATASLTLTVGMSSIKITPQGITISAPLITSSAAGVHTISGAMIRLN